MSVLSRRFESFSRHFVRLIFRSIHFLYVCIRQLDGWLVGLLLALNFGSFIFVVVSVAVIFYHRSWLSVGVIWCVIVFCYGYTVVS